MRTSPSSSLRQHAARSTGSALITLAALALSACAGHHHLGEYTFAERSMAVVVLPAPAPGLLTSGYNLRADDDPVAAVLRTGTTAAKNVEAHRARARLDSATALVGPTGDLAQRTLERASRYLGTRPVTSTNDADFLLEVRMKNFGLDARGSSSAYLYTNAEAVLLDRRTGREIWNVSVHGTDRLTPHVRGAADVPGAGNIIAAGSLASMSVADFQDALHQLAELSSNVVADELRAALRDVRK